MSGTSTAGTRTSKGFCVFFLLQKIPGRCKPGGFHRRLTPRLSLVFYMTFIFSRPRNISSCTSGHIRENAPSYATSKVVENRSVTAAISGTSSFSPSTFLVELVSSANFCTYAENFFSLSNRKHKIVHTGIKPYQCDVCQAGFMRKKQLHEHRCNVDLSNKLF